MANKARREALLEAVGERIGSVAEVEGESAGHHMVRWLRNVPQDAGPQIRADARALGVGVYPIDPFYTQPPNCVGFLLGYAGLEPGQIREGIGRLSEAIARYSSTQ